MIFREAHISDISQMQVVRNSVKENTLSDPALVKDDDYVEFLTLRGKGWVCAIQDMIVGFSVADLLENNVWALFVHPGHEKKGVGRKLHDLMMDWYFSKTNEKIWLGTSPGTRAETFYIRTGWTRTGMVNKGEVKFEMTFDDWQRIKKQKSFSS